MHIFTKPCYHRQDVTQGQFLRKIKEFELRVFFLLDWLPNQGKEILCPTIYIQLGSKEMDSCLSEEYKSISAKWNSLVKDLNLDHLFHFFQR